MCRMSVCGLSVFWFLYLHLSAVTPQMQFPFLFWWDQYSGWCPIFLHILMCWCCGTVFRKLREVSKFRLDRCFRLSELRVLFLWFVTFQQTRWNAMRFYFLSAAVFFALGVYSFFWIRFKMKMPVFKSVPVEKVMAMEHDMYDTIRRRRGIWR